MRQVVNLLLLTFLVTISAWAIMKTAGHFNIVPDSRDFQIGLAVGLGPFILLLSEKVNLLRKKGD